jgi:hypothetical protein
MRRLGICATSVAVTLVIAPVAMATVSESAHAAPKTYSSCDKLHKDFKHGVAKSKKAAKKQVADGYEIPAYSDRAKKVYWANHKNLDRDDDGTACEA